MALSNTSSAPFGLSPDMINNPCKAEVNMQRIFSWGPRLRFARERVELHMFFNGHKYLFRFLVAGADDIVEIFRG